DIELGDTPKRLMGNWSRRGSGFALKLYELAPQMRPTEGERHICAKPVRACYVRHSLVGVIAIAVNDAAIAREQFQSVHSTPARCVAINYARRIGPRPRSIITRERPKVAGFCFAAARIQYRRRSFIDAEF